jgi:pyruvate, water dikinase
MKSIADIVGHLKSFLGFPRKWGGERPSFKLIFSRFKEVLQNNNKALEIITDMGDKLGGGYLFDINYMKSAYADVYGMVNTSIENFDLLTQNKYVQLHAAFDRIDTQVKRMLYNLVSLSKAMVISYDDITWDMSHDVGGKNTNLAELKNYLKLTVPAAFAITTRAYDEIIQHNGLLEKKESLANDPLNETQAHELQEAIRKAEIPAEIDAELINAIDKIKAVCGKNCFLAVRSSAEEEDGEFSFAGQFETVLNVPLDLDALKAAYKTVIASLFSLNAIAYQETLGYAIGKLKMAVGCVLMVDAVSSGVIFTSNPDGDRDTLVINAAWGLGKSVVEGSTDADLFTVKKGVNPEIIGTRIGTKEFMIVSLGSGGTDEVGVPDNMRITPCLTPEQILELARQATAIEKHFRRPQDIEWAIDRNGVIVILQARPLRISEEEEAPSSPPDFEKDVGHVLMEGKGVVVQRGVGGGRVYILRHMDDLDNFPKGAVLVSRRDSSNLVRVMPYVSAIITDIGAPTSHMSSLCREFKIPTIVNMGNATHLLTHGQNVTVYADDEGSAVVYDGIVRELIERASVSNARIEDIYEYRKKRYLLRYISPLNLIDPLLDNFTPERCKTMHDILRFIHEKSVSELIDSARYGTDMLKKRAAVKLNLPIPAGIIVIDIGGGMDTREGQDRAAFEQITSVPFRAVIQGMMQPGVWHSEAVSLKVNDFMSSMMRMPDITSDTSNYVGYNIAVVSGEYMNLSLRFGYHFSMLDCYCSENAKNNHIYFRFVGGATDIVKRSRRVKLISDILKDYGFTINSRGDLIVARLANIRQDEMEELLDQIGRLISYTRQLDAVLHDDAAVIRYARNFKEGRYDR